MNISKIQHFLKTHILLLVILFFATLLRTYHLASVPVGLHGDEASIGYNAYSLLTTMRDQNGNFLPLAIDQFGDFRPVGYHYLDIPFVATLGMNEFSTRLPAALFGSATILAFYLLLHEFFEKKRLAIVGALLLAISPWHINISRATSEGVIAAFFVILGIYFYIKWIKQKQHNISLLIISCILLLISFFFYHSARFFVPVIMLPIMIFSFLQYKSSKKTIISSFLCYSILLLGLLLLLTAGRGTNRPLDISILNIPGGARDLKQAQDEEGTQNPLLTRFYDNKLIFYGRLFLSSYFLHLNGDFLFVNNGNPIRYKVPWTGNVSPIEAPLLLFGFCVLLVEGIKSKKWQYLIPILWLLIAPIPAGLTWEDVPNIQRASFMIYAVSMISAFGLEEILVLCGKRTKKIVWVIFFLLLSQNFLYFLHNYFYRMQIHEPWHRSAASKQLMQEVLQLEKKYQTIQMTTQGNNNLILYLFYNKFNPKRFQQLGSPKETDGLRFEHLLLSSNPCPLQGSPGQNETNDMDRLFIDVGDCKLPKNAEIVDTIHQPDGTPAYNIIKLLPPKN